MKAHALACLLLFLLGAFIGYVAVQPFLSLVLGR